MLKNITLASLVAGLVALIGCSKKEEPVTTEIKTETVVEEKAVETPVEQSAQPADETTTKVVIQAPETTEEATQVVVEDTVTVTTETK